MKRLQPYLDASDIKRRMVAFVEIDQSALDPSDTKLTSFFRFEFPRRSSSFSAKKLKLKPKTIKSQNLALYPPYFLVGYHFSKKKNLFFYHYLYTIDNVYYYYYYYYCVGDDYDADYCNGYLRRIASPLTRTSALA